MVLWAFVVLAVSVLVGCMSGLFSGLSWFMGSGVKVVEGGIMVIGVCFLVGSTGDG